MKMKKFVKVIAMFCIIISISTYAFAIDHTNKNFKNNTRYKGPVADFIKLSHPDKKTSTRENPVTDGVVDYYDGKVGISGSAPEYHGQGDRGQTYSWAAVSSGDYVYVSTLYNALMNTISLMGQGGLGHEFDSQGMKNLLNKMYNGDFFIEEEDGKNPGGTLCKINVKTGETKIIMSKETSENNATFRNGIEYNGKLYFCGGDSFNIPVIYEIDPATDEYKCVYKDKSMETENAWKEAMEKQVCPAIRGIAVYKGYLVISCVGLDENPYIAISKDPSKGFTKIASTFDEKGQKGELFGYPACHISDSIYGGSIWEMQEFNGALYVAICTGTKANSPDNGKTFQSFAIVKGESKGDPEDPNSWKWTSVIGDKKDGAKYTFGIDPERTRSGACNMIVYKDHLYIGEYNDTEIALINIMFDMDAEFMADNLEQSVNLYRMDKNENIEMVMGTPTKMFPKSLSNIKSGFGKNANQYIWRMNVYNDKLYIGTFDESNLLYPLAQYSNGDVVGKDPNQWQKEILEILEMVNEMQKPKDPKPQPDENTKMMLNTTSILTMQNEYEEKKANKSNEELANEIINKNKDTTITNAKEFHNAVLELGQILEKNENWTLEEKIKSTKVFTEKYKNAYNYLKGNNDLPLEIKNGYENLLTPENIKKLKSMQRCFDLLSEAKCGFDMYVTEDGESLTCVTDDGFGDPYNHGARVFASNNDPQNQWMCVGTANPFYGTQVWKLDDSTMNNKPITPDKPSKPDEPKQPGNETNKETIESKDPIKHKIEKLPFAGQKSLLIFISISTLIALGVISYKKYKNYKGI